MEVARINELSQTGDHARASDRTTPTQPHHNKAESEFVVAGRARQVQCWARTAYGLFQYSARANNSDNHEQPFHASVRRRRRSGSGRGSSC